MSTAEYLEQQRLDREWLANLKAGDEVGIYNGHGYRFMEVTKITTTLIIVGTDRYARTHGNRTGSKYDKWSVNHLARPTPELKAEIAARARYVIAERKIIKLTGPNRHYTIEQMEAVIAILMPKAPELDTPTDPFSTSQE